jgi:glycosyltransferase involved in cell wall biosynthesis
MAARGTRLLRELRRTYGERITLFRGIRPDQHAALYRQHDLTLWPTHFETLCLVGLMSLAAGTPVMTFNSAPVAELLNSDNAIIVEPEAVVVEKYMLPYVIPDYAMMDEMLYLIAKDTDYLHTLQRTVLHGLDERRNLFQQKMSQIFLTG